MIILMLLFVPLLVFQPLLLRAINHHGLLLQFYLQLYLFVNEKLTEIRYGTNPMQDLQEMVKAITNTDLSRF